MQLTGAGEPAKTEAEIPATPLQEAEEQDKTTTNPPPPENREEEDWTLATRSKTRKGYNDYLSKYPSGKYAGEARKRILELEEEAAWVLAKGKNTVADYNNYLSKYRSGNYAGEARKWIAELKIKLPGFWQRIRIRFKVIIVI